MDGLWRFRVAPTWALFSPSLPLPRRDAAFTKGPQRKSALIDPSSLLLSSGAKG